MNDELKVCANPRCNNAFTPSRSDHQYCSRECQVFVLRTPGIEPRSETPATTTHVFIPDTQVKPGVPTIHLSWIGQYIADKFAGQPGVKIIHAGDHWDFPSLSSYDKGKKAMEGRRYNADVAAGNAGFALLDTPIREKELALDWHPDKHITFGNHEDRVTRAVEEDAQLDGLVSLNDLDTRDWARHEFRDVVWLDGIAYSHYFYNPMTGRPYAGENLLAILKNIGHSFTQGHRQTYSTAVRFPGGKQQRALIAGAAYLHEEDYKGPQGNAHWRGILVCNDVREGGYNLMEVDLDYLCRRFEGMRLSAFLSKLKGNK